VQRAAVKPAFALIDSVSMIDGAEGTSRWHVMLPPARRQPPRRLAHLHMGYPNSAPRLKPQPFRPNCSPERIQSKHTPSSFGRMAQAEARARAQARAALRAEVETLVPLLRLLPTPGADSAWGEELERSTTALCTQLRDLHDEGRPLSSAEAR